VKVRFRSGFAYVDGQIGEELMPLFRLRYAGSASRWGFAMYRASHDDYEESFLPTGVTGGSPEEALDCACGLYLGDPSASLNCDDSGGGWQYGGGRVVTGDALE
jgi:hypothetical protein